MDTLLIIKILLGITLLISIISLVIGVITFLRKPPEIEDKCFGVECENGQECIDGLCKCIPQRTCDENETGYKIDNCGNRYFCGDGCLSTQNCMDGDFGYKIDNCGNTYYCGPCEPKTQDDACTGILCGTVSDGCGGVINCGSCSQYPNSFCVSGGTACDCTPSEQATVCAGRDCGNRSDNCGGNYSCGTCSDTNAVCNGSGKCVCKNGYQIGGSGVCVLIPPPPSFIIYYGADFYPTDLTFQDIPTAEEIKTLPSQTVTSPPTSISIANSTTGFNIPYYAIPDTFGTSITFVLSGISQPPTTSHSMIIDGINYTVFQIGGGLSQGDPPLVLSSISYTNSKRRTLIDDREYTGGLINLTAPISSGGANSNIPTFDANSGVGGYQIIDDASKLRLIYQNMRRVGMMVHDTSSGIMYTLLPGGEDVGPVTFGQKNAFIIDPNSNTDDGSLWQIFSNGPINQSNLVCTTTSCTLTLPLTVKGDVVAEDSNVYADNIFIKGL